MKILKATIFISIHLFCFLAQAQVKTNFNNEVIVSNKGNFIKSYKSQVDFELPVKNIDSLISTEKKDISEHSVDKPFQLATAIAVNLDFSKQMNWINDKEYAYGKFTVKLNGALSSSINFDKFYLPKGTEMYIYNKDGNIITGPITDNENNNNNTWGSWIYKGED